MSINYIGQKIWIEPEKRGRIIALSTDRCALVQEDYKWRVDGTKRTPIYTYARNQNGELHIIPGELNYVGMDMHRSVSSDESDHSWHPNLYITAQ